MANNHYYDGKLEIPMITINPKRRNQIELGSCSENRIWRKTDDMSEQKGAYQINICPEVFRDLSETIGILLHQMVHLYCRLNKIQDSSNKGLYHNKKFKEIASSHGLEVRQDIANGRGRGWIETSLTDEAFDFFGCNHNTSFGAYLFSDDLQPPKRTGGAKYKYVCPECKQIIRGNKKTNVLCGICKNHPKMIWDKPLEELFGDTDNQPSVTDRELSEAAHLFEGL